ncbi:Zn-ribbon-containing protein [Rodentibacter haemolyticus]|uniref:Zn-ribbon-containing protein n=1 Tax=Rodentibacter haemolyticus TaxID=2778911 RepID=A0ABX6UWS5_9PAST|nr:Zn-ribbon-containing protein [Rodentibacter haemolyticus]QPB42552.1 Zn-ribbon-containing protein [Rodentibacter haemolyticus]
MYLIETFFKLTALENDVEIQCHSLNRLIDQWRYNGQILGREIPLYLAEENGKQGFAMRVICPEQGSLFPKNNNAEVNLALEKAEKCGLIFDSFQLIGDDLNSDQTTKNAIPKWQVLYTTHLQSCSPIHSGENFAPIPLYKQLKNQPHLSQDVIKWQENWQACDQLQMNGSALEQQTLHEISDHQSRLSKHGRYLSQEIEKISGVPTYYYLYRVGGKSLQDEKHRPCPICGEKWALNETIFDVFHFKCDQCRLVSNLSWNFL